MEAFGVYAILAIIESRFHLQRLFSSISIRGRSLNIENNGNDEKS